MTSPKVCLRGQPLRPVLNQSETHVFSLQISRKDSLYKILSATLTGTRPLVWRALTAKLAGLRAVESDHSATVLIVARDQTSRSKDRQVSRDRALSTST